MEQIKAILAELKIKSACGSEPLTEEQYEQRKADEYNASVGDLDKQDGYNCEACKNKGFTASVRFNEQFNYYDNVLLPCKCQRVRKAIKRLQKSGLQNVVKDYTFDKYQTPEQWQQTIKAAAMKFCKDDENNWFFIGGTSGSGKSHICTAIAVHYIKREKDCHYMLWRDEIARIKAHINDPDEYGKMMQQLKETPVLYIDDLFKNGKDKLGNVEPPTAADVQAAFEILNYRYNNADLITIISSERTLAELIEIDEAIAGRIAERSKTNGYCINLKKDRSRNWRLKGLGEI